MSLIPHSTMEENIRPNYPTRRVYPGGRVHDGYKVKAMTFKPFDSDHNLRTVDVSSPEEYSSGCKLHPGGCFGHMCVSPTGCLLLPQSVSIKVGKIVPRFLEVGRMAFSEDPSGYTKELRKTTFTKHGHLRATMSTPIAGSARLVATPQISYDKYTVCISKELCESIVFCRIEVDEDGVPNGRYTESTLKEDDYCILLRPPSLTIQSVQPVKVKYWRNHCIGIHPELFSQQHGDYDGDEAHIYPLGTTESMEEAKAWIKQELKNFNSARGILEDILGRGYDDSESKLQFMKYTTVSASQIINGNHDLMIGNLTRNKDLHMEMMRSRFLSHETEKSFAKESARGTADVTRQQLSQSTVGEMSRVARITASCFVRVQDGRLVCLTKDGPETINVPQRRDSGSPVCRAIMSLCSVAQQALLDAHRVGSKANTGFDMISDMLKGRVRLSDESSVYETLCIFDDHHYNEVKMISSWCASKDGKVIAILDPSVHGQTAAEMAIGSYSPEILANIPTEERHSVCLLAILVVVGYHGVSTACEEDMADLASCLSYKPELSIYPTTTRDGALARGLSYIDTLIATDFTKLEHFRHKSSRAMTSTSCMYMGNFEELTSKVDEL